MAARSPRQFRNAAGKQRVITVMFFGPVAERAGTREMQVACAAGMRLKDLRAQLQAQWPSAFELVCFVAVNGEQVGDMSMPLVDGSEVVFMSKYSGG
jgi:molybdopterin converting factor small subunit